MVEQMCAGSVHSPFISNTEFAYEARPTHLFRNASANYDLERSCVPWELDSLARRNMWPKPLVFVNIKGLALHIGWLCYEPGWHCRLVRFRSVSCLIDQVSQFRLRRPICISERIAVTNRKSKSNICGRHDAIGALGAPGAAL